MIKEAEITDQTGVVYLREDSQNSTEINLGGRVSLLNPTFSVMGTGEETRRKPHVQYKIHRDLLPYQLLARTTGSELHDFLALLAYLGCTAASDSILTHYQVTFEIANLKQMQLPISHESNLEQPTSLDPITASVQAERLRDISGLTGRHLAKIFGVSRTTYSKWLSGFPLHDTHREHLLEVLPLMEEATQRLGSPGATSIWLLTPVSPGGKKPIDYLAAREYSIFRGFLLRVRTGQETFRPLAPSNRIYKERSAAEIKDALERLRPRAWRDDDDESNISGEEV
jgi:transcriptional regulator with XRE-family HTH domain